MLTRPLLRDELTDKLRALVLERRSDAPVRISAERELAATLGVSRISLRHALQSLVAEGLLVRRQGSGTYIVPAAGVRSIRVLMARDIKQKDPFYNELLTEVTHFCADHSVQLAVAREGTAADLRGEASPLVIVGIVDEDTLRQASQSHRVIVSTQYYPDVFDLTQLLFDDFRIGTEAAGILHDHGHSRVVNLRGPSAYPSAEERNKGFRAGAARRKLSVVTLHGKMNWRSGQELAGQVLDLLSSKDPPTAVFAANDWMALGLMQTLQQAQVRIPEQIGIIGCDDIHMASEVTPRLSTFKWDTSFMVAELFNIITAETMAESRSHKRILLPARFVDRESLDRAARSQDGAGEKADKRR
jgi:DNA-binding LacI/PurR family transcriptional regulator